MGTYASGRNAEHIASWVGTASTAAAEVAIARGANSSVAARELAIVNTGAAAMSFSFDGGDTWLPLAVGESFEWHTPVFSVYVKTASGTTTYAIVAGY